MSGDQGKKDDTKTPTSLPLSARALLSRQRNTGSLSGPGRLPSLRPARDLSLGATPKLNLSAKLSKRTFTPTIPTRRVKEEPKEQESSDSKGSPSKGKRGHQHGGEGRGRGRGRGGRGRHEVVASQSVFSMGPAEKGKTGHSTPSVSFSGDKRESKSSKVAIKKEKSLDYNDDESKRILKMLETEDDDTETECTEHGMAPVSIPLSNYILKTKELEDKKAISIKEEPMDVDMADDAEVKKPFKQKPIIKTDLKTEQVKPTCQSLFTSTSEAGEEKFIFIQLPDKLPIKTINTASQKGVSNGTAVSQNNEKTSETKSPDSSLKDVSEGYIGKLQVLKSGKTRLLLGDISLDVSMGTSCSFLQELVTVHTEENRSDMTVLGPVKHRVICTPDFEKLLTT